MSSETVLLGYRKRSDEIEALLTRLQAKQAVTVVILALAILATAILCFLAFSRRVLPRCYPPLPLPAVLVSIRNYRRQRFRISQFVRLRRFYLAGIERLEDRWTGNGISGEEFEAPDHVYAADLNLFGHG